MRQVVDGLLIVWVVGFGPLCWVLRDGLGPNSVDSHGLQAVLRFLMTFWWGPIVAVLVSLKILNHRVHREHRE